MNEESGQRRYDLGISSIPPVDEDEDDERSAESEYEYESEGREPPEP